MSQRGSTVAIVDLSAEAGTQAQQPAAEADACARSEIVELLWALVRRLYGAAAEARLEFVFVEHLK